MWGKKKSKKVPKGNKAYQQGYVSFTSEDLKQHAQEDATNSSAYDLLDQAMYTSSHIKERDKKNDSVDVDDIYPITADEANEMSKLLDKAEAASKDPSEPFFKERLGELRSIIAWSMKRHWNFQWAIIAGVVLTVIFLRYKAGEAAEDAQQAGNRVEIIEKWAERDTTIAIDQVTEVPYTDDDFRNANVYKQSKLYRVRDLYDSYVKYGKEYLQRADTASVAERKKDLLESAKDREKKSKEYANEYVNLNKLKFDDIHDMALEEAKRTNESLGSIAQSVKLWSLLFLFLIPLYIFAERPYGYTISRTRVEAKVLGGIKKFAFAFAGMLAGGALAMNFLPDTITKWSDGSTTREGDVGNFMILGIKLLMVVAAVMIVCVVSCVLMLYMTAQGLRRNYNWAPIIAKVKSKVDSGVAAAKKK